jgi:hypothetical protein
MRAGEDPKKNHYFCFMREMGGYGHARNQFELSIKHQHLSACLTIPDEAFLLLMVENIGARTTHDVLYNKNKLEPSKEREEEMRPKPLYTKGARGAPPSEWQSGWSPDGVARYNVLCKLVNANRADRRAGEWEELFLNSMGAKKSVAIKKRKTMHRPVPEMPFNTL